MSKVLTIEEKYKSTLNSIGLNNYEDFFKDNPHFSLIAKEETQKVFKFEAGGETFFLKINTAERLRKIFRALTRGIYEQPSTREVKNLIHVKNSGLPVMELAAWGKKGNFGIPHSSFILTLKVDGVDFDKVYFGADGRTRLKLFSMYGKIVAELHNRHLDCIIRPQDIMCVKNSQEEMSFVLIDREEGSTKFINYDFKTVALEFARLLYHGVKRYKKSPTLKEVMMFLQSYLSENKSFNLSPAKFLRQAMPLIMKYMKGRKSFDEIGVVISNTIRPFGSKN